MQENLLQENRLLRRKLRSLLEQARQNEKKQGLFDSIGFEIIGSSTPSELRDLLLFQMRARFQLQDIVLCLIDYDHDAERLFYGYDEEEARVLYGRNLIILDQEEHQEKISSLSYVPQLGQHLLKTHGWMMDKLDFTSPPASAALLPLIRSDQIMGALMFISSDLYRYQSTYDTTFLQKLCAMVAVAIENTLNQQRIKEIGYQDALTQAYNRRYFDLRFKDEVERSVRQKADLVCMFMDVDYFKKVNDSYGHHIGDLVLMRMVALLKEHVRACDIVARYGGEEFAVVLPDADLTAAKEIAERLRTAIETDNYRYNDYMIDLTVSIGLASISMLDEHADKSAEALGQLVLGLADKALYQAKRSGRNQVVVYSDSCDVPPFP